MRSKSNKPSFVGWRGIGLVAATYIYFLIFAQFGFLKRLVELGTAKDELKSVMAAMAVGGIAGSLLAPQGEGRWLPGLRLQVAFGGCAAGALLSLLNLTLWGSLIVSSLIGASVGVLTVTLVTHLRMWIGHRQALLKIGAGVGFAYLVCNYPPLFEASPATMASCAAALCVAAVGMVRSQSCVAGGTSSRQYGGEVPAFVLLLGCFTALVWLDSAAFFIIQHSPALKAGTWEGARRLWQIGLVHFLVALGSAGLINRWGLAKTLAASFTLLGGACLLLIDPARSALAALLYPSGVSLYSVALVSYPSFLAPSGSDRERAGRAGWLFALAGWVGSGLGIGMGENLRRIPPAFVLCAALLFFAPTAWRLLRKRQREAWTLILLLVAARVLDEGLVPKPQPDLGGQPLSMVARGQRVYLAEGCVHCHSQDIRPGSPDELMWGMPTAVEKVRAALPPMIGNRRQGPDLANVGNRRSPLWLKAHFKDPQAISPASSMPSYAHLFSDERGDALVAYLGTLGGDGLAARLSMQSSWLPSEDAVAQAARLDGKALFRQHCATCHAADGVTRQACQKQFKRLPPDLSAGPLIYAPLLADPAWRFNQIARIIKFGLPAADMPGHEYLADAQVAAIARHVVSTARDRARRATAPAGAADGRIDGSGKEANLLEP